MAMTCELEVGWVADKLGPTSGHWKRSAWAGPGNDNREETGPCPRKREGPTPLNELDQNIRETKRKKEEAQGKENVGRRLSRMVVWRLLRGSTAEPNDHINMELSGNGISSYNSCSH